MASYEEYAKKYRKDPSLESEISEASQNQADRQERAEETAGFEIPERFKGKSAEEIARSYVELERLSSAQANELGSYRKLVAEREELQSYTQAKPPESEEEDPITVDDLYSDTETAIRRAAKKEVDGRVGELEQFVQEAKIEKMKAQLAQKYPDWETDVQSDDFAKWVQENPYRTKLAQDAHSYDFYAADALFGLYNESKSRDAKEQKESLRKKQLRDATLETSSPGPVTTEETFSRTDVSEAKRLARQGNRKAKQWLDVHSDAIFKAYAEGRIVN
jgi:hypothetical protein